MTDLFDSPADFIRPGNGAKRLLELLKITKSQAVIDIRK